MLHSVVLGRFWLTAPLVDGETIWHECTSTVVTGHQLGLGTLPRRLVKVVHIVGPCTYNIIQPSKYNIPLRKVLMLLEVYFGGCGQCERAGNMQEMTVIQIC